MACKSGKRLLPRRDLPFIGPLLDKMPYSKFPTNLVVLQRILVEIANSRGSTSVAQATLTVRNKLVALWEYTGYGEILKPLPNILVKMKQLHIDYKSLVKVPHSRRDGAFFKSKLKKHYAKFPLLFNNSDKLLQTSNLITKEDRDFLLFHWEKTISSTKDIITAKVVEKKLERSEKYKKFSEAQPQSLIPSSPPKLLQTLERPFFPRERVLPSPAQSISQRTLSRRWVLSLIVLAHLVPDRGDDTCVPLQQEPTYRGAQFPCSQGRISSSN